MTHPILTATALAITLAMPSAAPGDGPTCPLVDGPVTYSASLRSGKGSTGGCKINESGTLVITRTGTSSASIVADGVWADDGAGFDAKTCTVSHAGLKPKAPIDVTVSYVAKISPSGALSGSAQAVVKDSFFACKGQYSVSGKKQ